MVKTIGIFVLLACLIAPTLADITCYIGSTTTGVPSTTRTDCKYCSYDKLTNSGGASMVTRYCLQFPEFSFYNGGTAQTFNIVNTCTAYSSNGMRNDLYICASSNCNANCG